jgi:hypothetical protein
MKVQPSAKTRRSLSRLEKSLREDASLILIVPLENFSGLQAIMADPSVVLNFC